MRLATEMTHLQFITIVAITILLAIAVVLWTVHLGDLIAEEFEMELAVARLDERCQRLIRLLYFDSKEPSYAEIAADLGMLVGSIGPTRARCLDKLKKLVSR